MIVGVNTSPTLAPGQFTARKNYFTVAIIKLFENSIVFSAEQLRFWDTTTLSRIVQAIRLGTIESRVRDCTMSRPGPYAILLQPLR